MQKCRQKILLHQKRKLSMLGPNQKRVGGTGTGTMKQLSGQDKPERVHGEIIEVKADKIRVLYYDDRHRIWHSRFKMPQYDKKKSPIEHSGKKSLSDYHWRLVSYRCRCVFVCCVFAL